MFVSREHISLRASFPFKDRVRGGNVGGIGGQEREGEGGRGKGRGRGVVERVVSLSFSFSSATLCVPQAESLLGRYERLQFVNKISLEAADVD